MRWSCALAIAALAAADILSSAVASPVRHEAATNFLEERPRPAAQTRAPFAPLIAHPDAGASIPGEYVVWLHPHAQVAAHGSAESVVATRAITDELLGMMARDAQTDDAVRVLHRYESGFAVRLGVQEDAQVVLDALRSRGDVVAWIEPNQLVHTNAVQVNPPSWGLARIYQREFRVRNVYRYPDTAGEDVDVYVIDTGVQLNHTDFGGRVKWVGDDSMAMNEDANGHGTHVASTIAGNELGVAKRATIIAVKVLSSSGSGTIADVIAGIEWAARDATSKRKRSAANMSLGGGHSDALDAAVAKAIALGLPMAVAAGNTNRDACRHSPASVKTAVTVGASKSDDQRASFSNHGPCVDIFAPGDKIVGAGIGPSVDARRTLSGTSMASPHVAGVMALFLAEHPYTPAELKTKLSEVSTADVLLGLPPYTVNLLLNNDADSGDRGQW